MRRCLMCRQRIVDYYGVCEACNKLNEDKRKIHANLKGYNALVTGGRINIGYATVLRLLRDGANVIALTRFPYDALDRYKKEDDYEEFKDRLTIYGFDLMYVNKIDELLSFVQSKFDSLDIIVNNAAQTIRKAPSYYLEMKENEKNLKQIEEKVVNLIESTTIDEKENNNELIISNSKNELSEYEESPNYNSWVAKIDEISVKEMLEVQLINVTAPFLLIGRLKEMMKKSPHLNKFIINVSSVEGKFLSDKKLARHVHTNMAKASLNMMTQSVSSEYKKDRIFIYSVDPGYVSNQFPTEYGVSKIFKPYLTFDDAASRICNPIYTYQNEEKIKKANVGTFLKNYKIIDF